MKTLLVIAALSGLIANDALAQRGQSDPIRRAKEVVNQSNVRQGVPPPAPPQPSAGGSTASQAQSIARIQADLAMFKPGTAATAAQRQQLIKDLALACRGTKPSLATVTSFVNDLTSALTDKLLDAANQSRLARNIDATLNSGSMAVTQFNATIDDVQAILQVADAKRKQALTAANSLKNIGLEVRKVVR